MGKKETDYGTELEKDYQRWFALLKQGGHDPTYTDGVNMDLVRRHIIIDKKYLEDKEKPEEYGWPLPMEVPRSYMARAGQIWYGAIRSYQTYLEDENYQYLCQAADQLSSDIKKKSCLDNVLGYAETVRKALLRQDYVTLRLHEKPDRYLESFEGCRKRIGELLLQEQKKEGQEKDGTGQLNLFQMGMSGPDGMHR